MIEWFVAQLEQFVNEALRIWEDGGWAMVGIAIVAFVMFAMGVSIFLRLMGKRLGAVPERVWRQWIEHPRERRGPIGELLDLTIGGRSLKDTATNFQELRATEIAPFERDLKVMKICVTAAPLLGLLGTVIGMLTTFNALSDGSGGDQTMALVAEGISEALITTMTGLVIALPGLFFQYLLVREHERYKTFLAHLETVCTQVQYKAINRAAAA